MARSNVYLGKSVKDVNKKGLDSLSEVEGIAKNIIKDYQQERISYRTAISRMNLLELVVSRDSDFKGAKKKKARKIVDKYRAKLMSMKE
ncbi:MAG: hypothetical protein J7L82_03270 [Staphylothermus sp.]|nr:hypothetical protein [Staphylothermus sp.]